MQLSEFRDFIERDAFQPFTIITRSGRSYPIQHRSSCWLPPDYERIVCVSVKGKGINLLDVNSIESVQIEHDVAALN